MVKKKEEKQKKQRKEDQKKQDEDKEWKESKKENNVKDGNEEDLEISNIPGMHKRSKIKDTMQASLASLNNTYISFIK